MKIQRIVILLIIALSMMAIFASSAEAAGLGDSIGKAWDTVMDVASLKFLGSSPDQVVGFIRIIIGILIFTILYLGISMAGDKIPKNIGITIAIILAVLSSIFMPASILTAIGIAWGAAFSFILLGGLLAAGFGLILVTPTPNRVVAAFKLGGLILMAWILGQINYHIEPGMYTATVAGGPGGFVTWVNYISDYGYYAIIAVGVYLIWLLIKGGDHVKVADKAWGAGAEAGSALFGGAKKRGWLPWTKEHHEKYGDHTQSKRAMELELGGFAVEKHEKKVMLKVKADIGHLKDTRTHLISLTVPPTTDAEEQFKAHYADVDQAVDDLEKETEALKNVGKSFTRMNKRWPKYLNHVKDIVGAMERKKDVPADIVNKLKIQQRHILAFHEQTKTKIETLKTILGAYHSVVDGAKNPRVTGGGSGGGVPAFSMVDAQAELRNFTQMDNMETIADDCVKLQADALKGLEALMILAKKVM